MLACSVKSKKISKRTKYLVFGYIHNYEMNSLFNIPIPIPIINIILLYYYNKNKKNELKNNVKDILLTTFNLIEVIPYIIIDKYLSFKQCTGCDKIKWGDSIEKDNCYSCNEDIYFFQSDCIYTYSCGYCEEIYFCCNCYSDIDGNFPCHDDYGSCSDDCCSDRCPPEYNDGCNNCGICISGEVIENLYCTICEKNIGCYENCYKAKDCEICSDAIKICQDCLESVSHGKNICSGCIDLCWICDICDKLFTNTDMMIKHYLDDSDDDLVCLDCDSIHNMQKFKDIQFCLSSLFGAI